MASPDAHIKPRCWPPAQLVVAGAHHRTGSEMLTRVMGVLCKRCCADGRGRRVARWKAAPASASASVSAAAAVDGAPCQVDSRARWEARTVNASYAAGLRLLSSGAWDLAPSELARALPNAPWRMVHLVRDPFDAVVSAYHYHQTTDEPWVHEPSPAWHRRMGLRPPLPSGASTTFAQQLRALDRATGVVLQAQQSRRTLATMVAVAEACAPPRCTNLRLDDFQRDFDAAASALLRALGARPAVMGELGRAARRVGRLSPTQASNSSHVTRGKHRAHQAALLATLAASPLVGPPLRRLRVRLELRAATPTTPTTPPTTPTTQQPLPPCALDGDTEVGPTALAAAVATAAAAAAGARPPRAARGWWSSTEDVHVLAEDVPSADACCARCRAAEWGCLFFNWQRLPQGGGHRCTLLTSRLAFTPGARFVTGSS